MVTRLTRLRVRTRLYAGFGLLILLTISVAGLAISRLEQVKSQVATMSVASKHVVWLDEIVLQLEVIRRATFRFAVDANPAARDDVTKFAGQIVDSLGRQALESESDTRRAIYKSLQPEVQAYGVQFEHLVLLQNKVGSLQDRIVESSRKLTDDVVRVVEQARAAADPAVGIAAAAFERALMTQRVDGRGLRITGDPSLVSTLKTDRDNTNATLTALGQVQGSLTLYIAGWMERWES
jgi:hypothetical protein